MTREAIIERLAKLDTCAVSDALDSLNLKGATWGVRPQWLCPKIAGRAVTMKIKPAGLQQPTQHLGTAPIEVAQAGDVIVITYSKYFSCRGKDCGAARRKFSTGLRSPVRWRTAI